MSNSGILTAAVETGIPGHKDCRIPNAMYKQFVCLILN
jgi:hypothetical protein